MVRRVVKAVGQAGGLAIQPVVHQARALDKIEVGDNALQDGLPIDHLGKARFIPMHLILLPFGPGKQGRVDGKRIVVSAIVAGVLARDLADLTRDEAVVRLAGIIDLPIVEIVHCLQSGELMDAVLVEHHHQQRIPHKDHIAERFVHIVGLLRVEDCSCFADVALVGFPGCIVKLFPFRVLGKMHLREIGHIDLIPAGYNFRFPGRAHSCPKRDRRQQDRCGQAKCKHLF